jgi:hypothetical protein
MQVIQTIMSQPWMLISVAAAFVVAVSIFMEHIANGLTHMIFGALRLGKSVGYLLLIGLPLLIFAAVSIWAWRTVSGSH